MKRVLLLLAAVIAVALPILVIAQSKAPRDSSATKPSSRERIAREYNEKQRIAAERARMAADRARAEADRARHRARRAAHADFDEFELDALAEIAPAVEGALEGVEPALLGAFELVGPAMEEARAALADIDFGEINDAMQDASESLARLAPIPPLPPISGIPPFPALAPFPDFPPIPDIPPMPDLGIGRGRGPGRSWGLGSREFTKNLNDEEQIRLQALAALLDNDEKTALPEIKTLARQNESWAMRACAVSMLANAESADVVPILEEVLNKDTDQRVRKAAVRALSQRDEPAAREALKRLLLK